MVTKDILTGSGPSARIGIISGTGPDAGLDIFMKILEIIIIKENQAKLAITFRETGAKNSLFNSQNTLFER